MKTPNLEAALQTSIIRRSSEGSPKLVQ